MRFGRHIVLASCAGWLAMAAPAAAAATAAFDTAVADARAAMLIDPRVARRKAAGAEPLARAIGQADQRRTALATTQWLQAEASIRLGDTTQADALIDKAAAVLADRGPATKLKADILLTRGGVRSSEVRVAEALADYQNAFRMFARIGNARSQAIALMSIASLYSEGKDNIAALRYLDQAVDVYQGDPGLLLSLNNNRAAMNQELNRGTAAESQYLAALEYAAQLGSPLLRAQVLGNLARNRMKMDRLAGADSAIALALAVAASGDAISLRPKLLAIAAEAARRHGDLPRAAALIAQSFAGVALDRTTFDYQEPHRTAYETFRALGHNDQALAHLAALKRLDDEATKLATTTSTALMGARFDFANQELRIAKLKAAELQRTIEAEHVRAQTQRYLFYAAAGTTAVVIGMLVFALVTERRSRDRVRAANAVLADTNSALGKALAAKTEFLATTSHEIRTPLNGILGMTQVMLADAALAAPVRERLGVVHAAGVTMRALVDDILDMAKIETGNLTIETVAFDLKPAIADAARMWADQAAAKGLEFELALEDCPRGVASDPVRLRQIVFNLLSNAVKFTDAGRVSLRVTSGVDRIRIIVADTGIGIPVDKRETIFESFRQADSGTTRRFGGTGLGLAICRNLARAMDGDVEVDGAGAHGTMFTVTVPLVPAVLVANGPGTEERAAEPALLVIDRNPIMRSMWRTLLTPHAPRLVFAGDAQEAVDCIGRGGIGLALIDDAAIRGETMEVAVAAIVATARARGIETNLLWPIGAVDQKAELLAMGITRVIDKPVSGPAVIATLFAASPNERADPHLVTVAA